jgi:hypothetical protein
MISGHPFLIYFGVPSFIFHFQPFTQSKHFLNNMAPKRKYYSSDPQPEPPPERRRIQRSNIMAAKRHHNSDELQRKLFAKRRSRQPLPSFWLFPGKIRDMIYSHALYTLETKTSTCIRPVNPAARQIHARFAPARNVASY